MSEEMKPNTLYSRFTLLTWWSIIQHPGIFEKKQTKKKLHVTKFQVILARTVLLIARLYQVYS